MGDDRGRKWFHLAPPLVWPVEPPRDRKYTVQDTMAVPLLSFTPSLSPDAQRGKENNKGFFLRTDNLSPRCLHWLHDRDFSTGSDFTPTDVTVALFLL